jgi:cell pole-organizing protein PopZ
MVHHPFESDGLDTEEVLASIRRAIEADFTPSPGRASGFAGILGGDDRPRSVASRMPATHQPRPLMSRETELRTRAAFKRLSEDPPRRVASSPAVDEAAQDYLRAAIKRWVDNNLPALAERLVREEIERVMRSARR